MGTQDLSGMERGADKEGHLAEGQKAVSFSTLTTDRVLTSGQIAFDSVKRVNSLGMTHPCMCPRQQNSDAKRWAR